MSSLVQKKRFEFQISAQDYIYQMYATGLNPEVRSVLCAPELLRSFS